MIASQDGGAARPPSVLVGHGTVGNGEEWGITSRRDDLKPYPLSPQAAELASELRTKDERSLCH